MKTDTLGRLVGDAANALSWLEQAWMAQKEERESRHLLIEAGERFESIATQLGTELGWQEKWKRRDDGVIKSDPAL